KNRHQRNTLSRRSRRKKTGPDDVFQHGPLRISRWGNVLAYENLCSPDQQKQLTKHFAEQFPTICARIDERVAKIASIVKAVDPLQLMVRSYWQFFMSQLDHEPEESKTDFDDLIAVRMLDYIQSIIVGTTFCADADNPNITADQFNELRSLVGQLYNEINPFYFIAKSASLAELSGPG